jgi:hypothetical protein
MSTSETRLCIENEDGIVRKVAMVTTNASGIYVSVPYHKARHGFFFLTKVQNRLGVQTVIPKYKFAASSRAKLSLHPPNSKHPDYFLVHFSGHGIVSGFDENGRPKGCALKGPPMPEITTGPTFGLIAWGLQDFDLVRERDKNVRVMTQERMYPTTNDKFNAYNLEFFLLPNSIRKAKKKLSTFYKKYIFEGVDRGFDMVVLELPEHQSFLGVVCIRRKVIQAESGYNLSSPRLLDWMISGTYPAQFRDEDVISLDYVAPNLPP